jgi:hypothetical protein
MPAGQQYSSNATQTTLVGAINNSVLSLQVASTTGFPTSFPFSIAIDVGLATQEVCDVTNVVATTFTVQRGVDSSTAQSHANAATVTHVYIGRDAREARAHIDANGGNDSTGKSVHGLTGNVVGTTDVQTLTNKTLIASGLITANAGLTVANGQLTTVDNSLAKPVAGPQLITYSPGFNGTGFTMGNGTQTGGYVQYGKQVFFEAYLVVGSTTVMGTTLGFNLPLNTTNYVTATGTLATTSHGFAPIAVQNGLTTGGAAVLVDYYAVSGGVIGYGNITATAPLTVDTGTVFFIKGTYQATT